MSTVRPSRPNVRALATALLAVITAVSLAGCGAGEPEGEGKTPKPPKTQTTKPVKTTDATTSADPSETATTPATTPVTPPPPKTKTAKVTVKQGVIKGPARLEVKVGQIVQINIGSDVADELHVHGLEQTFAVPAGERVTVEFVVPAEPGPGRYIVELHALGQLAFGLTVH